MKRVFVAGHRGMVGSAIVRKLAQEASVEIITCDRKELDLTQQVQVNSFFKENRIDEIYIAAAKVGGIFANSSYPAHFIYENLMIEVNIIHAAHMNNVPKILFLGSSCIYPKFSSQPIKEKELLTGKLEPTNEPYAIAKIAGLKLCESYNRQYGRDYRSVMPTNLYGQNDNFHPENSHVVPALIRRFHEAKINQKDFVDIWGTGRPRREFLHVDDMADACVFVMNLSKDIYASHTEPMLSHINVGTGEDCSIEMLAQLIAQIVGFQGEIRWNTSKPDGTPQKLLDVSKLRKLGWRHTLSLRQGLEQTYQWFIDQKIYR